MTLTVNGTGYEVGTIDLKRSWTIEEKYGMTSADGTRHREVRGVYKSYALTLRNIDNDTYDNLIDALTDGSNYHTITLPYGKNGAVTFEAIFKSISDELVRTIGSVNHWDKLSISFDAKSPGGGL